MGLGLSQDWLPLLDFPTEVRVCVVGLDAAGKSTFLYKLKFGESVTTIPSIGLSVETIKYQNMTFLAWDLGSVDNRIRHASPSVPKPHGMIFIVDSNDRDRLEDDAKKRDCSNAKDELSTILAKDEMMDVVLLVLANKQDMKSAMKVPEISEKLGLSKLKHTTWGIQGCSMVTREGVDEAVQWLAKTIHSKLNK